MAVEMGIQDLDVYGDSQLVISQLLGEYEVKKEDLIPYHKHASRLLDKFDIVRLSHVLRSANKMANALAGIAATLALGAEETIRSFDKLWSRCLEDEEAAKTIEEFHSGIYGAHQSGSKLHERIKRMGYYWPSMVQDCMEFVKKCEACQFHANFIHQPPEPLHPNVTSLPFEGWGLDVFGPITPKSSGVHAYTLAATDYFSKWAEAIPLREVEKRKCCRFHSHISSIGMEYLKESTTYKNATHSTPYALVYGVEAVLPLKLQIPSLRIAIQEGLTSDENDKLRLAELEALDEKILQAQQKLQCYQARMSHAFIKKVQPCSFQVGDMVLAVSRPIITSRKTGSKFTSKWDGRYVVREVYTNGAYEIVDA
uniref:RNase H type-1 domain-containing protein n=1 Tax=Chenopodium quinoa TaxID=63459 RepID=A0A803M8C3_CHEQI